MNLLEIIPSFKRQLLYYLDDSHTDSILAGYLADSIEALNWRWTRDYVVTFTPPQTYVVNPDITAKDKRPIILMGSIIYKGSNLASFRDGDFAWDPSLNRTNPILDDLNELDKILGKAPKLAKGVTSSLRGFNNAYNPESYYLLLRMIGAV